MNAPVTKMVARIGDNPQPQVFVGRFAWTLNELVTAGQKASRRWKIRPLASAIM